MSEYRLIQEIIKRSTADDWDHAKQEWALAKIYFEPQRKCLCGHFPILEICVLRNTSNGRKVEVGNCCVQKFMGFDTNKLFASVKKVMRDTKKALIPDVIELMFSQGCINPWEHNFYLDIRRKEPTENRQAKREEINKKILAFLQKQVAKQ